MTKSIRTILKPFLIISYVFGLRIANLSNHSKPWFSVLYMLLIWSTYYFLSTSKLIFSFVQFHSIESYICHWLEILTTLLSIIFGIYHDKKFQSCLKKLDIVDNTLFRLGIMIDYDKQRKKTVWLVVGWFALVILMNCINIFFVKDEYECNVAKAMSYIFILNYCFHINFIGDLTTANILEYIGLKFDQLNEYLQNLMRNDTQKIIRAWENPVTNLQQHNFSKILSTKCRMWIIIHLQLELYKIFREIDSIFGTQMTFKMACYFGWVAIDLREILYAILINNYVKFKIRSVTLYFIWLSHDIFKIMLINYMCERVTNKASATANSLNKLFCFTCDIEIREIISQFSLRIVYAPLRFYGIGFFQFGFKFLHRFVMSVATVLVIIIQARANYDKDHKK